MLTQYDREQIVRHAMEAFYYEAEQRLNWTRNLALDTVRPHVLMRPTLSIDGNKWCALYGANLQDGVAGFGDSPEEAMLAFDKAWSEKLSAPAAPGKETKAS